MKILGLKVSPTIEGISVARRFSVYKNEDAFSHSLELSALRGHFESQVTESQNVDKISENVDEI
jgi:hypothetical protein